MKENQKQPGRLKTKINFISHIKSLTVKIPEAQKSDLPYKC